MLPMEEAEAEAAGSGLTFDREAVLAFVAKQQGILRSYQPLPLTAAAAGSAPGTRLQSTQMQRCCAKALCT